MDVALHVALLLALPPLLTGIINRTKAVFAGRQGPPLLQLYYDLLRLFRKDTVISSATTWVFHAGPAVSLTTVCAAGLLIPLSAPAPVRFTGDFILAAYLLAAGRFFVAAAAMDTGSPFEGMGASREVTFAALVEPAFFAGAVLLAKISGSLSLSEMLVRTAAPEGTVGALLLLSVSWFIILLAENSRIPFDDPNTHLELTMVHEVMVLDHSGPLLGLIEYASSIKLFLMSALVVQVIVPFPPEWGYARFGVLLGGVACVGVAVGVVESSIARLRLNNVPKLIISATLLTLFGFVLLLR